MQTREMALPQRFVQNNSHGVGQVERADLIAHRDPDTPVRVHLADLLRDSAAFFAEHQVIVRPEICIRVNPASLCRRTPDPRIRMLFQKILKIDIPGDVEPFPVIHTGPPDLLLRQTEPQRLDQMQRRSCRRTRPPDISRITRYLRFMQDNMHDLPPCSSLAALWYTGS